MSEEQVRYASTDFVTTQGTSEYRMSWRSSTRPVLQRMFVITDDTTRRSEWRDVEDAPAEPAAPATPTPDRDVLGRVVREAWVRWALTQPAQKPSWLVPYDDLAEPDKEADRQIGEAVAARLSAPERAPATPERRIPQWIDYAEHAELMTKERAAGFAEGAASAATRASVEAFIQHMGEEVIPEIVEAVRQRQRASAETRYLPLGVKAYDLPLEEKLQTEREMHNAWRKRAEQAERERDEAHAAGFEAGVEAAADFALRVAGEFHEASRERGTLVILAGNIRKLALSPAAAPDPLPDTVLIARRAAEGDA